MIEHFTNLNVRPDCKPITAKAHQYPKNSFDIIQIVAILAHKGLKDGVNKAEFCFQATNHSGCDSSFFFQMVHFKHQI